MAPKVVCWRPMYDPSGHDLLRDAGAEVEVVDTTDAREVILVILKKIDMENAVIWDRSECPLSGVKRTLKPMPRNVR